MELTFNVDFGGYTWDVNKLYTDGTVTFEGQTPGHFYSTTDNTKSGGWSGRHSFNRQSIAGSRALCDYAINIGIAQPCCVAISSRQAGGICWSITRILRYAQDDYWVLTGTDGKW